MADECVVCTEKLNKSKRMPITCVFCNYVACKECVITFLTGLQIEYHCMSCRNQWSTETLLKMFPRATVNDELADHRKEVLYDREKARLPEAQMTLERERRFEERKEKEKKIKEKIKRLKTQLDELRFAHRDGNEFAHLAELEEETAKSIACPMTDCKGFLIKWRCGICQKKICRRCRCEKEYDEEGHSIHECDEDEIKSVKAIVKDSRPCPSCGLRISRVEGCNQMWCTKCKTPFNWNTGNIIKGNIHNPHFYDWQRQHQTGNIHPAERGCGDPPVIRDEVVLDCLLPPKMSEVQQNISHMRHVVNRERNDRRKHIQLGVKYLKDELDEDEYKRRIYLLTKREEFDREEQQILETYVNAGQDIFWRIHEATLKKGDKTLHDCEIKSAMIKTVRKCYRELYALQQYTIEHLHNLGKIWKYKTYEIIPEYLLPDPKKLTAKELTPKQIKEIEEYLVIHNSGGPVLSAISDIVKKKNVIYYIDEKETTMVLAMKVGGDIHIVTRLGYMPPNRSQWRYKETRFIA